jgi:transcriptional regulator with XRE-family HTH domain
MATKKTSYNLAKLADHMKKRRLAMRLSREELADRAGVNYNTVIKLESGANQNPTIQTLIGLAGVLKIKVEDFLK